MEGLSHIVDGDKRKTQQDVLSLNPFYILYIVNAFTNFYFEKYGIKVVFILISEFF